MTTESYVLLSLITAFFRHLNDVIHAATGYLKCKKVPPLKHQGCSV